MANDDLGRNARRLASAIEPFAGQVYFSPEAHTAYAELGFSPSDRTTVNGVALPDGPAYFSSRGASMGTVPGELVAAAFAVFNPAAVVPAVSFGRTIAGVDALVAARRRGAVGQLVRILGPEPDDVELVRDLLTDAASPLRPEGRPLFSGVLSLPVPEDPLTAAWHLADLIREFRGDSHTAAWISAGFDATEIGLVSELWWGLPARTYVRSRAWSDAELDAAEERLTERGLLADGELTEIGRDAREAVEVATDEQMRPTLDALGDRLDALVDVLTRWGAAIRDARGYLPSGPHDLASTNG